MRLSIAILVSVLVLGGAVAGYVALRSSQAGGGAGGGTGGNGGGGGKPVVVYCAAGLKKPVEAAAAKYKQETGATVQLQFGGSQTLLTNAKLSGTGDLYLPADDSYLDLARKQDLIAETAALAVMRPVLAVKKGNPKGIKSLDDATREGVRIALADPKAAAVGKVVERALTKAGKWDAVAQRVVVTKPTVNEVANDVQIGSVDAAFVWDAIVNQSPDALEAVPAPEFADTSATVSAAVLKTSSDPTAALRFLRYLSAADKGLAEFKAAGFTPVAAADPWDANPTLTLFAGSMLRPAVEETVKAFEAREGVRVTRVYNGCGILVAQMKAAGSPDAYFACDVSFMSQVKDLFLDPVDVSVNQLVILVPKANPKGIATLRDLATKDVKIGVGHEKQCALGALTEETLKQGKLYEQVRKNVRVESPTGDLLVNQLLAGSLDAVVAYVSNATGHADELTAIKIDIPCALAVQPMAVAKESKHKQLTARLMSAIRTAESKDRFEAWGFRWADEVPAAVAQVRALSRAQTRPKAE